MSYSIFSTKMIGIVFAAGVSVKRFLMVGGAIFFVCISLLYLAQGIDAFRSYRLVPAIVVDAIIVAKRSSGTRPYTYDVLEVRYKYKFNGVDYESGNFECDGLRWVKLHPRNSIENGHNLLMYKVVLNGREGVYAWVDEDNPKYACLFRDGFRFLSLGVSK